MRRGERTDPVLILRLAVLLGVAQVMPAGCALPRPGRQQDPLLASALSYQAFPDPSRDPRTCAGAFCTVRSYCGVPAARHAALMFDAEFRSLQETLGGDAKGKTDVTLHATLTDYRTAAGFPPVTPNSRGRFHPLTGQIHVAVVAEEGPGPSAVLRHEAAHRYLHATFDFPVPQGYADSVQGERLLSVPWWLHEGLAACMEAAGADDNGFQAGLVNSYRHRELRHRLLNRECPRPREVIGKPLGAPFNSTDYAVAWGIVHTLMYHGDPAVRAERRQRLRAYLGECAAAFFDEPAGDFEAEFVASGQLVPDFDELWRARIARRSLEQFARTFLSEGQTLDQWEEQWRREVFRLR